MLVADVVNPVWRLARTRIGTVRIPVIVRRSCVVHRTDDTLDDIVNVGKVTAVVAVVEHVDGLTFDDIARKHEQGHVRAAERPVDREEAKARSRQAIEIGIRVRHQFIGFLGCAVKRQRMVHVLVNREWHRGVGSVDRARRGVHEVFYLVVPASFQDVQRADDVAFDVAVRVFDGVTDTCLCDQVHDLIKFF